VILLLKGKKSARVFQIQSTVSVISGEDTVVHVGTSYGKTIAIVLPIFVKKGKIMMIVSPSKMPHVQRI
jgi:ATP-dependent helicase YprA (DUF1998 family)